MPFRFTQCFIVANVLCVSLVMLLSSSADGFISWGSALSRNAPRLLHRLPTTINRINLVVPGQAQTPEAAAPFFQKDLDLDVVFDMANGRSAAN